MELTFFAAVKWMLMAPDSSVFTIHETCCVQCNKFVFDVSVRCDSLLVSPQADNVGAAECCAAIKSSLEFEGKYRIS